MASNYPTFELGLFDDTQELDNVSEMVETSKTSDKSKDQQLSESATGENNRFANLSELDLEKIILSRIKNQRRPRKTLTGVFPRSRVSFKLK